MLPVALLSRAKPAAAAPVSLRRAGRGRWPRRCKRGRAVRIPTRIRVSRYNGGTGVTAAGVGGCALTWVTQTPRRLGDVCIRTGAAHRA